MRRIKGRDTDHALTASISHDVQAEGVVGVIAIENDAELGELDRDRFELLAREVEVVAPWLLSDAPLSLDAELRVYRRHRTIDELEKHRWNVAAAARALQVPRTNLYDWIKNLNNALKYIDPDGRDGFISLIGEKIEEKLEDFVEATLPINMALAEGANTVITQLSPEHHLTEGITEVFLAVTEFPPVNDSISVNSNILIPNTYLLNTPIEVHDETAVKDGAEHALKSAVHMAVAVGLVAAQVYVGGKLSAPVPNTTVLPVTSIISIGCEIRRRGSRGEIGDVIQQRHVGPHERGCGAAVGGVLRSDRRGARASRAARVVRGLRVRRSG